MHRFSLLVVCFVSVTLAAQESRPSATVRVNVQSASGPVSGATVTVNGISAVTDEGGLARLFVNPGMLEVRISKDGFLPGAASVAVESGQERELVVELQPLPTVEEEITVFATRTETRLEDQPTRVEVLVREEIEEKMLMTPGDIVMMLNEMGGLRVQATSPSLGAASVRIQGMKGRYTLFLADGLPLFGQVGGLGLLQVPPMDLGQVEVIKGAASALYGAGAMGGVVNLVSRRPGTQPSYEVLFNQSNRGATDALAFLMSPLSTRWKASLLAGGHYQTQNDVDRDGWTDLAGYERGVLRSRLFFDSGTGSTGFLTGGITFEDRKGGTVFGAVLPVSGAPYSEALDTRRYDVGGNGQFVIKDRYALTIRAVAASQRHHHQFGNVLERDRHNTFFGEAWLSGAGARHTWVAGVGVDRNTYDALDVPSFSYRYTTPGGFVQDDININSWLSVSASGRLDFHSEYGTFASPRISVLLRGAGFTSRVSASQGFFASTPLTEEIEAAGLSRLQIPRPLKPERGRTVSFDLTRTVGPGSYTLTLFASRIRNPLHVERDMRYELTNLRERATNVGVELVGIVRHESFSATGTYTFVRSRETTDDGQKMENPLTPRHSVGIVGMWENENGRVGVESYYTGRQRLEVNPYRSRSQPYVIFGMLAERRFGPVRLFLNAENLTNVRQTRWDPLLRPDQGPDGRWTVDAWAPLEGRVFNGGVRLNF